MISIHTLPCTYIKSVYSIIFLYHMHMVNQKKTSNSTGSQIALLSPQDLQSTCHDVSDPGIAWRNAMSTWPLYRAAGWKSNPNKDQLSTWDIVKPGQTPSFINCIIQLSGFTEVWTYGDLVDGEILWESRIQLWNKNGTAICLFVGHYKS